MAQLNWSEPARDDLKEIIRYYGNFSHKTALYYSDEILKELIYLYENDVCSILMVWDCRQNPNSLTDSDRFES